MSDWLKIAGTVGAAVFAVWSMVQQHEYRLEKLEHSFEALLVAHDEQYKEIAKSLRDIDLTLARMNAPK